MRNFNTAFNGYGFRLLISTCNKGDAMLYNMSETLDGIVPSIGYVIQGQVDEVSFGQGHNVISLFRGDRTSTVITDGVTLVSMVDDTEYHCLYNKKGWKLDTTITTLPDQNSMVVDTEYMLIADGDVEIDGTTHTGTKIVKLSETKTIKSIGESIIVPFDAIELE